MSDSLHMVLPQFPDFYFEGEPAFHGQSKILNVSPWLKTQLGSRTKRVKSKAWKQFMQGDFIMTSLLKIGGLFSIKTDTWPISDAVKFKVIRVCLSAHLHNLARMRMLWIISYFCRDHCDKKKKKSFHPTPMSKTALVLCLSLTMVRKTLVKYVADGS